MKNKKGPLIRDMIITPIAIVDPPILNAAGLHAPYALRTVVEIITDDNISGISEIPGNIDVDKALEGPRTHHSQRPISVEPDETHIYFINMKAREENGGLIWIPQLPAGLLQGN